METSVILNKYKDYYKNNCSEKIFGNSFSQDGNAREICSAKKFVITPSGSHPPNYTRKHRNQDVGKRGCEFMGCSHHDRCSPELPKPSNRHSRQRKASCSPSTEIVMEAAALNSSPLLQHAELQVCRPGRTSISEKHLPNNQCWHHHKNREENHPKRGKNGVNIAQKPHVFQASHFSLRPKTDFLPGRHNRKS